MTTALVAFLFAATAPQYELEVTGHVEGCAEYMISNPTYGYHGEKSAQDICRERIKMEVDTPWWERAAWLGAVTVFAAGLVVATQSSIFYDNHYRRVK